MRTFARVSLLVALLVAMMPPLQASSTAPTSSDPRHKVTERQQRYVRRLHRGRAPHLASTKGFKPSAHSRPTQADNFRVLGRAKLGGATPHGDVFFFDHGGDVGKHAYVGTWGSPCSGEGVKIVDVNKPSAPAVVARTAATRGVSHEDLVVSRIGGRDVLVIGIQQCGGRGKNGIKLVDVTNPSRPDRIGFFETPGGVHELDVVERLNGQVLALLAVPFLEFGNVYFGAEAGGEVRIVDISDPSDPVELSHWGAIANSSIEVFGGNDELTSTFQGLGSFASHFAHSVRAADRGNTAYVSYWDGGVLKLDIGDPASPRLVARTSFSVGDDGDAHSMFPLDIGAKRYILQNDEDGDPLSPTIFRTSATGDTPYSGIEIRWVPTRLSQRTGLLTGTVHNARNGCKAFAYKGTAGKIALANTVDPFYKDIIDGWTVPCPIGEQILLATKAGAKALVLNFVSPDDPFDYGPPRKKTLRAAIRKHARGMPVLEIADIDELAAEIRSSLETGAVRMTARAGIPSWGYLRVYDESTAEDINGDGIDEYRQVGHFFDLPHVRGDRRAGHGAFTWTIHNTEVNGDVAYSSWYGHGIVGLDVSDPKTPSLVGQFVPRPSARFEGIFGPPGAQVWGVAVDPDTGNVYASDMRSGLWIVKPLNAAAP